ncbi:MAG: ATP-binding protein [Tannerella sp.]|nr:ATP-binding protein [Tannerella sp.]
METTIKRLPYGNSNFNSIMTENYAYVDKTRFIGLLENEANKNQFFIRPRKFGKSLFYSMLYHYYDLNKADDFEKLFGNLYIGKHPTPKRNSYAVMPFNFSGLDTSGKEEFKDSLTANIRESVRLFMNYYRAYFHEADVLIRKIDEAKHSSEILQMAYGAAQSAGIKIFVLVDEYDHFANDLIAMGKYMSEDVYKTMVAANGLVRNFYETLKTGTSTVIDRIFITGISPVMLNDLTSGFNIADNLTFEWQYNEMMGFTQAEVNALMVETGVNPDWINVDMSLYYNGYLFHKYGESRVYNPSMILYFFKQILREERPPKNIIDENLKTDYGRIRNLVRNERNREKLLKIVKDNGIESDIVQQFSIDRMYDDEYFVSLLVYMGLLTIDKFEKGSLRLKIPNYSIQTLCWEYIAQMTVSTNEDVVIDLSEQKASLRELAYEGNPYPYIEYVSHNIFNRLSNRDLIRFDEKYIKIMLFNGLFQSNLYVPVSEAEVEDGYMDIFLHRSPLLPDIRYEWLWEVKYLKKEDAGQLKAVQEKSVEQLKRYRSSIRFEHRTDVKFASILFIGKDRYEIIEI